MSTRPLQFGDDGMHASRDLAKRIERAAPGPEWEPLRDRARMLATLDRQHGSAARLDLEDADALVEALLRDLARLEGGDALVLGVAVWAMRHAVAIGAVEPVVNALARTSNEAGSKAELAAAFGLMLGFATHVGPQLAADLERSNPERPWRILHVNLAVTAIRTEDGELMDRAFDRLDAALPDERAGFYAEALALALAPGIAPPVRERIEARYLKWTARG